MAEPVRVLPRAAGFHTDLVYAEDYPGTDKPYVLKQALVYRAELPECYLSFGVSEGFRYDRASVPSVLEWAVPKDVLDYGAVIHDALYAAAFDKDVADRIFYLIVRTEGQAGRFKGRLAWRAVQLGGWPSWLRHWRRRKDAGRP